MDEEYMIKMAEEKGIFGDKTPSPHPDSLEMKRKSQTIKPSTASSRNVTDDESEGNSDADRHKLDQVKRTSFP
jgi:hypothetical protein